MKAKINRKFLVPALLCSLALSTGGCNKDDNSNTGGGTGKPEVLDCAITSNKTLTDHNPGGVDYIVSCDLEVQDATLTIGEGVTIQVETDKSILINDNGKLVVNGSSGKPVQVQGKTSGPAWKGIKILSRDPGNRLNYLHVSNTGSSNYFETRIAGTSFTAKVGIAVMGVATITNTTIEDCAGVGIAYGDEATIAGFSANTFRNCASYPVLLYAGWLNNSLSFANTTFTNNSENYIALYSISTNAEVDDQVIINEAPVPYLALKSLTFMKPAVFNQGVTLYMNAKTSIVALYQDATLTMNGTATKPVIIKGRNGAAGYWNGLLIGNDATGSLNYVHLSDGGGDLTGNGVPFQANYNVGTFAQGNLTLANCTSSNSGSACDVGVSRTSTFVNSSPAITNVCVEP